MQAQLAEPKPLPVEEAALALSTEVGGLVIADDVDCQRASDLAARLKALLREADAAFDPIIAANRTAVAVAVAQKKAVVDPIDQDFRSVKKVIGEYLADKERERLRLAELSRIADRRLQEEETLARAQRLENAGRPAEALRLLEQPLPPRAISLPPAPKVAGISTPTTWSGEVTDFEALLKAAVTDPQARALLKVDQVALNALARALKSSLCIPGVVAISTTGVSSKG